MLQGWIHVVPKDWWPWLMVAAGVIALGVIVILIGVVVRQGRALSEAPPRMTPAQQRALERDVSNLLRDLSELARQVGSQLDGRAVRLEALIREADERMERLEETMRAASSVAADAPAGRAVTPPLPESPLPLHPALLPVTEPRAEGDGGRRDRHLEIYTLADQGLALADIARRLRRPNGEVELILALRPQASRVETRDA